MAEIQEKVTGTAEWLGQNKECRRSYRRKTLAPVAVLDGPCRDENAVVTNVSLDGAYIRTNDLPVIGSRLSLDMRIPSGRKSQIRVSGRVVRTDELGLGFQFEDLHSKDRSRLRHYSAFVELDEIIVDLQNAMRGVLPGNLMPVSEWVLIEERLVAAAQRRLKVLVIPSRKGGRYVEARIAYDGKDLFLQDLSEPIREDTGVFYCAIVDGPLCSIFEGLVLERGIRYRMVLPERMYINERRWSRRTPARNTWLVVKAPHLEKNEIRMPVMDVSEGGCSVVTPKQTVVAPGMRFPSFHLFDGEIYTPHEGATVARVIPKDPEGWLLGLNYLDHAKDRDAFSEKKDHSLRSNRWSSFIRLTGMAKQKFAGLIPRKTVATKERVCLVRYKNTRGDMVAALLDATFDLNTDAPAVDAAIVIGPPFPVRKEAFSLLARTLVDNFRHQGLNAVVIRFDLTHGLGESEVDPEMEAKGQPYLRWTYSNLESDMIGSMNYVERRFQPKKRIVISYSVAAIAARRMIADAHKPGADLFIAPFGCPDGQDMFKNLLAGVDLFPVYQRGEKAEPFLIYGRLADPSGVLPDAIERGMAFLEDARKDMEKIKIPVVWIVGTYDYMVTRSRVRQMLNAPGGGPREIIELPTGHNPRTGAEAIESFKLIFEFITKYLYSSSKPAVEPDLALYAKQQQAEWARTKRKKFNNAAEFWNKHLFGTAEDKEGYDVLLFNPDYVDFIDRQVELLDLQPGQSVADIGCGTGNFSLSILKNENLKGKPFDLTCMDLVPGAVECTRQKLEKKFAESNGDWSGLGLKTRVLDLEASRFKAWREFLSGRLYGLSALINRVEGLHAPTIRKIEENYGQEIHNILRGDKSYAKAIQKMMPSLDPVEAEIIIELSIASRYLEGKLLPEDLWPNRATVESAEDLCFRHLQFGKAGAQCRIDCDSESFDRIGGSLILPYLYDPEGVLTELLRMLKPGGVMVLSSLKPNFDSSKSYLEEAEVISKRQDLSDQEKERLLASLREFGAFVGHLMELEDEGRFRFFNADDMVKIVRSAGFTNVRAYDSFGNPPTAVIVRAEKSK